MVLAAKKKKQEEEEAGAKKAEEEEAAAPAPQKKKTRAQEILALGEKIPSPSDIQTMKKKFRSFEQTGKGGFGTLLKGQSKQAGAKTTLDFGACRDLSGRRLRHVNDEIKYGYHNRTNLERS